METLLCDSLTALERAEPAWRELCSPEGLADHPFWTAEWLTLWWEHFGAGNDMRWVVVRDGARPVALAPLWRKGQVMSCFGEGVTDYAGFLLPDNPEGVFPLVWDALVQGESGGRRVVLDPLPTDSPTWTGLRGLLDKLGWPYWGWPSYEAPAARWPEGWDAYWAGRKSKLKANLRRRRRNLESLGEVTVVYCESQEELDSLWPEAQRLHRARWHGRYTQSLFTRPVGEGFYKALAREFLRRGWLDMAFLSLDGRPIAFHFGFRYKRRYYYYIPAFDPRYAPYAPSTQLLVRLMRRACQEGFEVFDFLIGNEPYKYDWATETHVTGRLVFPMRRQGWSKTATALAAGRDRLLQQCRESPAVRRLTKPVLGRWQGFFR